MKSFEEWPKSQQVENPAPEERAVWKGFYDEACARAASGPTEDDLRLRFCDLATQYDVAGRSAAMAQLTPVYGNLVHHAVEMFLKTALVGVVSLEDMKSKYVHNIKKLWDRFKAEETDPALDQFDAVISAVDAFEDLRYPDKIFDTAINVNLTWQAGDAVQVLGTAASQTKKFEFFMSHVDDLVIEIMGRAGLNPKYFTGSLSPRGREALEYQNSHASAWLG